MTNVVEADRLGSRNHVAEVVVEVTTGDRVGSTIDQLQWYLRLLQRRDPALAVLFPSHPESAGDYLGDARPDRSTPLSPPTPVQEPLRHIVSALEAAAWVLHDTLVPNLAAGQGVSSGDLGLRSKQSRRYLERLETS